MLMINAGIISGAFIFLSLSITNLNQPERESISHLDRQTLVAYLVIVSFSLSSVVTRIYPIPSVRGINSFTYIGRCYIRILYCPILKETLGIIRIRVSSGT